MFDYNQTLGCQLAPACDTLVREEASGSRDMLFHSLIPTAVFMSDSA